MNTPDYKPTHPDKKSFLEFYENELNLRAEDFCIKAKVVSEKLLRNETLFKESTLEQQEFKQFLKDFLRDYHHIERYKLYEPLFTTFINVLITNYHMNAEEEDEIKASKFQQMIELYFSQLLQEYKNSSKIFIKEKFLPKFEELKKLLNSKELREVSRTIDKMTECQNYGCFPTNINPILMQINVNYDIIAKYEKLQLKKGLIYFLMQLDNASKNILKNDLLKELSSEIKQNLTRDINDFISKFESNKDITSMAISFESKQLYFLKKYYKNMNFSLNDRKLLNQILEKVFNANDDQDNKASRYDLCKNYIIEGLVFNMNLFDHYLTDRISSYTDLFYI